MATKLTMSASNTERAGVFVLEAWWEILEVMKMTLYPPCGLHCQRWGAGVMETADVAVMASARSVALC